MEPLVSSLASQVAPEMVARLARPFGSDPETVGKALKLLAGLAVARLAAGASSAEGAAAVLRSLPQQEEPGLLASLVGAFKGDIPSETPADRMQALFGGGVNSMLASLSRTLGFDLGPLVRSSTPPGSPSCCNTRMRNSSPRRRTPPPPRSSATRWRSASGRRRSSPASAPRSSSASTPRRWRPTR
jgi:hypothetical protein